MAFCGNCGTKNQDVATFCGNCGAKLEVEGPAKELPQYQEQEQPLKQPIQPVNDQPQDQTFHQQPVQPQYRPQDQPQIQTSAAGRIRPPRTGWLTYVLILNWIGIVFLCIVGFLFMIFFFVIGLMILGIAFLFAMLTQELNKYNKGARTIQLVLSGLSFLFSVVDPVSNFVPLVLAGLHVYALLEKETVKLFQPSGY